MSLFDMGMYRTRLTAERELSELKDAANKHFGEEFIYKASSYVDYDFDKDKVNIQWHVTYNMDVLVSLKRNGGEKEIIDTQEKLNKLCLIILDNLESSIFGQSDYWAITGERNMMEYFGHFGYKKGNMPDNLYRNFASKIVYAVVVHHNTFYARREEERNRELRPTLCQIGFDNPLSTTSPMYIDYHKDMKDGL